MLPRPIQSAPMETGLDESPIKVLVYCPDEGGWHVGVWLRAGHRDGVWMRQGWRAAIDHNIELRPTHWLPYPEEPTLERTEGRSIELHVVQDNGSRR